MPDSALPLTTEWGGSLKDLHRVLVKIAVDIDRFCAEHEITYYLMGGTALGAMRHRGFIPWDDDFDIFMDRENYLKFLVACEEKLDTSIYYLQREDTEEWPLFFSKIRLNHTLYVEREEEMGKIHSGLYIDVMCLHNVFSNRFLRYLQFLAARFLSTMGLAKRGYETGSRAKRAALLLGALAARTPVKPILLRFTRILDGRKTELVGHFFGRAPFKKTTFKREFLGTPRPVPFEDVTLPVPEKVEDYLACRFGPDYMQMPSQQTRDAFPSHLISFDLGPYS